MSIASDPKPASPVADLTDQQIVALTLYGEARSEPIEGIVAVGCVIRNRYDSERWGTEYSKVCLAPWQFSCFRPEGGKANYELVMAMAKRLAESTQVPEDRVLRQCAWVAMGIIGGWLADNTKGATHYVTAAMYHTKPPTWAINKQPAARIASHVFFAGIR